MDKQQLMNLSRGLSWQDLVEKALTDQLTGLLNRHGLKLAAESVDQTKLALLMIDIDHFKSFNDRFGHEVGDQVLQGVAKVLESSLKSSDILGRWGGEEFIAIIPFYAAGVIADRLRHEVAKRTFASVHKVSISVGVSRNFESLCELNSTRERADQALYRAKRDGRNCVRYG